MPLAAGIHAIPPKTDKTTQIVANIVKLPFVPVSFIECAPMCLLTLGQKAVNNSHGFRISFFVGFHKFVGCWILIGEKRQRKSNSFIHYSWSQFDYTPLSIDGGGKFLSG